LKYIFFCICFFLSFFFFFSSLIGLDKIINWSKYCHLYLSLPISFFLFCYFLLFPRINLSFAISLLHLFRPSISILKTYVENFPSNRYSFC
jgi:hypothetical protein